MTMLRRGSVPRFLGAAEVLTITLVIIHVIIGLVGPEPLSTVVHLVTRHGNLAK